MPDVTTFQNLGLVGVLALFVWKLPEIVGLLFGYLRERQLARDREFEKLGEVFRSAMVQFQQEQQADRELIQKQFRDLVAAMERQVCGFAAANHQQVNCQP